MNKHTKGPWQVDALGHVIKRYEDKTNSYSMDIATVSDTPNSLGKPDQANARLIAAAPELLEACEKTLRITFETSQNTDIITLLTEAINQAKGE